MFDADPSTEQPGTEQPGTDEEQRRLSVIRGLLAKAEATEYPEEAQAFFAKASELIARWALDEAVVWAAADASVREAPEELRLLVHAPYLAQKAVLISAVAQAHGCRAIRLPGVPGDGRETVSVVGFPSELRWVETLVTSLLVQLTGAMLARCPGGFTPSASAGWRRSFIMGFAGEVADRLDTDRATARSRAQATAPDGGSSASLALVLASRDDEVRSEFSRRFPRVRSSWASSGSSAAGSAAGRAAGREASLDRRNLGGRRALGPA